MLITDIYFQEHSKKAIIPAEYKVKQLAPSHATHISAFNEKFLSSLFSNSKMIVQRKYDGERMLIHFNGEEVYCTSRRYSKKTGRYMENQDKLKNLPKLPSVGYTVIDCECYSNTWSDAVSVLHSLPERALSLQDSIKINFAVFDCLFYDGKDVTALPYHERLKLAQSIVSTLNQLGDFRFHNTEQFDVQSIDDAYTYAKSYWQQGKEGVVLKPLNLAYYDKGMMIKIKRFETVDLVVCGYQEGNGKYQGLVGALYVGYYDNNTGSIIKVSKVNCSTDKERKYWTDNMQSLVNKTVIEIKCQEITEKSLRHPVYVRIREDKTPDMCTRETIFKE